MKVDKIIEQNENKLMNPLVSFCVKSYNQRRYLKAALEGAWSQTYRPLEIVVSDDGSTDGSWEEIQQFFATRPAPGGVSVVLNRNEQNLGSLGNWEKLCSLAHGELIVKADGDDISIPERSTRIVEAWENGGRKAMAICHSGWQIGIRGEARGKLRMVRAHWPLGAAMAFSPKIFKIFGFTDDGSIVDDEIYSRRAMMLGPVMEIPDRLVKYRIGSGQTTENWNLRKLVTRCTEMSIRAMHRAIVDIGNLPETQFGTPRIELERTFISELHFFEQKQKLLISPHFSDRLCAFRAIGSFRFDIAHYQFLAFLMPRPIGDAMLFLYALLRNTYWRLQGLVSG